MKSFIKFFIFSLILHLGLLWSGKLMTFDNKIVYSENSGKAIIKISLRQERKEMRKIKSPIFKKIGKKKIEKEKVKESRKESHQVKTKALKSRGEETVLSKYLNQIRSLIEKHKFKSRLADKLKLTGRVIVGFTIVSPNSLVELEIVKSSGRKMLDNSALQTLKNIPELPVIPLELKLKKIPLKMDITYSIN